jgi:hypothetical protein
LSKISHSPGKAPSKSSLKILTQAPAGSVAVAVGVEGGVDVRVGVAVLVAVADGVLVGVAVLVTVADGLAV